MAYAFDEFLNPDVKSMVLYPHLCRICLSDKNLFYCSRCKGVRYCSMAHQLQGWSEHKILCEEFAMSYLMDVYMEKYWLYNVTFCPEIKCDSVELNKTIDIIKTIQAKHYIPDPANGTPSMTQQQIRTCASTMIVRLLGSGLNILNALRKLKINCKDVIVHVSGTGYEENSAPWIVITEIIKYFVKGIETISYYFADFAGKCTTCAKHTTNSCVARVYSDKYENICRILPQPNLICFFNKSTTEIMLGENIQTLLQLQGTGFVYTGFCQFDMCRNREYIFKLVPNLQLVEDVHYNCFQEFHPIRNVSTCYNLQLLYRHKYVFLALTL